MAITEDNFTQEEFDAAITKNPALIANVRTSLGTRKFIIHDETEHQNYLKTVVEPNIVSTANKKFHENLEKDVKELTGMDKSAPDEKSYVYLKRAVGEKLGTIKQMETEIENLKKGGNTSAADKLRIEQLEAGILAKENEYKTKLAEKDTTINTIKASTAVENKLAALRSKFKDNLPKAMVDTFEKTVVDNIVKMVRFNDKGEIVLYDGDKLQVGDNLLPITVEQKLTELLGDIIDTGKKGAGTGTKEEQEEAAKNKDSKRTDFTSLPADVTTKVELSAYLLKLGYLDGSPDFDKILAEHGKNLPLRK